MKHSIETGFTFGSTSGIITTLGLMVGLNAGTALKLVVIGGVATIAIADAFSDALGIHMSEEAEHKHTTREIWEATIATFVFKFLFTVTFIVPLLLFDLSTAIIVSIIWGLSVLGISSFSIAKKQEENPWKAVGEHLLIASLVIVLTHNVGNWISVYFR